MDDAITDDNEGHHNSGLEILGSLRSYSICISCTYMYQANQRLARPQICKGIISLVSCKIPSPKDFLSSVRRFVLAR